MIRRYLKYLLQLLAILVFVSPSLAGSAPKNLAGFVLGGDIANFEDRVAPDTEISIRYAESIKEVEIRPVAGLKSGLIAYGTCAESGRILRIKLKYENSSKKFYQELLKRYKQQLGEPKEWRGDPFHVLLAWKWSYTDENGDSISLILQHNTRNEEEKMGNAVKLTNTTRLEREADCGRQAESEMTTSSAGSGHGRPKTPLDWNILVPR